MSKERNYKVYFDDIIEASRSILKYTKNYDFIQFSEDRKTIDAVIRNLEIIGEAAKKIPPDIIKKYPKLHWRGMTGMRDKLIHQYFGVNLEIIWDTILKEIPKIFENLQNVESYSEL